MSLVTCAGSDVLRGRIRLGIRGPWFAELELDTATMPSGGVTPCCNRWHLSRGKRHRGSRPAFFLDTAHVRLIGGAGALGTRAKPSAYTGAVLHDALSKLLGDAGETMSTTISSDILGVSLPLWTVVDSSTVTGIDNLCGAATTALGASVGWRVLSDGTIWLGVESWPAAIARRGLLRDATTSCGGALRDSVHRHRNCCLVSRSRTSEKISLASITGSSHLRFGRGHGHNEQALRDGAGDRRPSPPVAGTPPIFDRLAMYRAEVKATTSDGSKLDVQPENAKIPAAQGVSGACRHSRCDGVDSARRYCFDRLGKRRSESSVLRAELGKMARPS